MTASLRALGSIVVGVFVMSVIVASVAQAREGVFEWEAGATELAGTSDAEEGIHLFKVTGSLPFTCDNVRWTMKLPSGTAATELETSTITYNALALGIDHCKGALGAKHRLTTKGCQLRFHAGKTLKPGETVGTMDFVCPPGEEMTTHGGFLCTVHIPPQDGLSHVIYRTVEDGEDEKETVAIAIAVSEIRYTHVGLCGRGGGSDGSYVADIEVMGRSQLAPKDFRAR